MNSLNAATLDLHLKIRSSCGIDPVKRKYGNQKLSAKRRGVEWQFTFEEWMRVWIDSGKWEMRGRGKGQYCMARHGDVGPYNTSNVSIILSQKNSSDGIAVARSNATEPLGVARGSGRGWTVSGSKKNPYQVVAGQRYIGLFATESEAISAYKKAYGISE